MRRWIAAAAVMTAALGAAVPGMAASTSDLGLIKNGQLSVASDIPYAPFEFTRPGSSTVIGFDVDLVNAAARKIGINKVSFVKQKFDTILLVVAQNRFDMAASSVSITPERAKRVLFSSPYFLANQSIMVRKGGLRATRLRDLEGKRLGVQRGTTGADLAATVKGAKLSRYEIIDDAFNALAAGRVEAVVNDFAISAYAAKQKPSLQVTAQVPTREGYGLVFAKNKPALRAAFNRGLAQIRRDGTYARIYKKWFGTAPPK
jgi:ABC-type amino acid transport substrate-binding protein